MNDLFKQTSLEIYLDNLKNKLPEITPHELEMLKYAFETGFNLGSCSNSPQFLQEIALIQLSK